MVYKPRIYSTTKKEACEELDKQNVLDDMLRIIRETFPEMEKEHIVGAAINLLKAVAKNETGAMILTKKKVPRRQPCTKPRRASLRGRARLVPIDI